MSKPDFWYCPRCVYRLTETEYRSKPFDFVCPRCYQNTENPPRVIDFKPNNAEARKRR